ncbi:MAG: acyl-CoA carboxylase subunit epsilon [Aldersonia sp.]|nr:acyl-CoA carboxylase subunit epsilon [Aldersonia sp.]
MTAVAEDKTLTDTELAELEDAVSNGAESGTADPAQPAAESAQNTIKVLKGNPDDVELAALVAVLAAAAASGPAAPVQSVRPAETWGMPAFMHRGTPPFSPYAYPYVTHLRD